MAYEKKISLTAAIMAMHPHRRFVAIEDVSDLVAVPQASKVHKPTIGPVELDRITDNPRATVDSSQSQRP